RRGGGPLARRLHLSRRAPGRAPLRDLPRQRERGGGAARRALRAVRPHAGRGRGPAARAQSAEPDDARPALELRVTSAPAELDYSAVSGHYDEMTLPSGELRPHWRDLVATFQRL